VPISSDSSASSASSDSSPLLKNEQTPHTLKIPILIDFSPKISENTGRSMSSLSFPERGPDSLHSIDVRQLAVYQPSKVTALLEDLNTIEAFTGKVSEMTGEDRSGDLGSGGTAGATQGDDSTQSTRATQIANLPAPEVMQQKIEQHIHAEIKQLEKLSKAVARSNQPGSAYHLNELYAKIRRLNSLLATLIDTSMDVLKRLFVRIFIDKQPIFSS
jgi:hypothetical protein